MNNLTLRQLRAFAAVAKAESFTAAARELHLTQSALSMLVRELERGVEIQLLDRNTRRVRLSDAGVEFLPTVLRTLNDLDEACAHLGDLRDLKRGIVRVAAPQLMACCFMPDVIATFRGRYPNIVVDLHDTLPESLLDDLKTGRVELAVGQDILVEADIDRQKLFSDRHMVACKASHPLASRNSVSWRDLEPFTFIAPTRDFRRRALPELAPEDRAWLQRRSVVEVSYVTTALGMVSSGLGVTICPTHAASLAAAYDLVMIELCKPEFSRDVCVYMTRDRALSPAAARFLDALKAIPEAAS